MVKEKDVKLKSNPPSNEHRSCTGNTKLISRDELKTKVVRAPKKNGRGAWWLDVLDISDCGKFLKVGHRPGLLTGGKRASGKAYWVGITQCTLAGKEILLDDRPSVRTDLLCPTAQGGSQTT